VSRTRYALGATAVALGSLGLASVAYQSYGIRRDRRLYPPPGDLVDVGDRKLHMLTTSGDGPPIVIITALATPGIDWLSIQRSLANDVPVVLYDRGGVGWSDAGRRPRTAARMADELHGLLTSAQIEPPYVLAGHSLGGLIALIYSARHREDVAGLALIDSSHPDMERRLPAGRFVANSRVEWLIHLAVLQLSPLGLVRLADDLGLRRRMPDLARRIYPPDVAAAGRALMLTSRQRREAVSELIHINHSCDEARGCLIDLGTLPLAVLTSSEDDPGRVPGSPAAQKRSRWYGVWSVLQSELTELSRNSSHTIAERAGHHIHRDEPQLVVEVLRDLAYRARQPEKR
jgi:pimeloyl-ACP methyl ester carboxylesterase